MLFDRSEWRSKKRGHCVRTDVFCNPDIQTEEKLRKDKIVGAETATSVHYNVGKEVRTAIEKIGGTMPEDLPTPEKSIQQIEKEQMQRLKNKAKKGKLMLDE